MTTIQSNENRFYLGFNKDTGQLVEVVAPEGSELLFGPEEFNQLNKDKLDPEMIDSENEKKARLKDQLKKGTSIETIPFDALPLKEQISRVWVNIRESAIPEIRLTLADKSGNTICGGSCGGIPFWMCGP